MNQLIKESKQVDDLRYRTMTPKNKGEAYQREFKKPALNSLNSELSEQVMTEALEMAFQQSCQGNTFIQINEFAQKHLDFLNGKLKRTQQAIQSLAAIQMRMCLPVVNQEAVD